MDATRARACARRDNASDIRALLINIASSRRAQARGTRCVSDRHEGSAIFGETDPVGKSRRNHRVRIRRRPNWHPALVGIPFFFPARDSSWFVSRIRASIRVSESSTRTTLKRDKSSLVSHRGSWRYFN